MLLQGRGIGIGNAIELQARGGGWEVPSGKAWGKVRGLGLGVGVGVCVSVHQMCGMHVPVQSHMSKNQTFSLCLPRDPAFHYPCGEVKQTARCLPALFCLFRLKNHGHVLVPTQTHVMPCRQMSNVHPVSMEFAERCVTC